MCLCELTNGNNVSSSYSQIDIWEKNNGKFLRSHLNEDEESKWIW